MNDDPAIHCALAQAKAVQENADVLLRFSLYEQRLNRTLVQAEAKLKQLPQARSETEKYAFPAAESICKLKQALGQPWKPARRWLRIFEPATVRLDGALS